MRIHWFIYTPGSGRSLVVGNGNPLQFPCLGNPVDRGAWRAEVLGVTVRHDWACKHNPDEDSPLISGGQSCLPKTCSSALWVPVGTPPPARPPVVNWALVSTTIALHYPDKWFPCAFWQPFRVAHLAWAHLLHCLHLSGRKCVSLSTSS